MKVSQCIEKIFGHVPYLLLRQPFGIDDVEKGLAIDEFLDDVQCPLTTALADKVLDQFRRTLVNPLPFEIGPRNTPWLVRHEQNIRRPNQRVQNFEITRCTRINLDTSFAALTSVTTNCFLSLLLYHFIDEVITSVIGLMSFSKPDNL